MEPNDVASGLEGLAPGVQLTVVGLGFLVATVIYFLGRFKALLPAGDAGSGAAHPPAAVAVTDPKAVMSVRDAIVEFHDDFARHAREQARVAKDLHTELIDTRRQIELMQREMARQGGGV